MADKDIIAKSSISADLAARVIEAAVAHAQSLGKGFAVAIVVDLAHDVVGRFVG